MLVWLSAANIVNMRGLKPNGPDSALFAVKMRLKGAVSAENAIHEGANATTQAAAQVTVNIDRSTIYAPPLRLDAKNAAFLTTLILAT